MSSQNTLSTPLPILVVSCYDYVCLSVLSTFSNSGKPVHLCIPSVQSRVITVKADLVNYFSTTSAFHVCLFLSLYMVFPGSCHYLVVRRIQGIEGSKLMYPLMEPSAPFPCLQFPSSISLNLMDYSKVFQKTKEQ